MRYLVLFLLIPVFILAQNGGNSTYQFLNLVNSAREVAVGGNLISVRDGDLNLAQKNPSLLDSNMSGQLALSYVNYFTDINYGYASVCSQTQIGTINWSVQYVNYGEFVMADYTGIETGIFSASEYALTVGWGQQLYPFLSIGANIKTIFSSFETYNSFGLAADLAATYFNTEKLFTAALLVKNAGLQVKPYVAGNREPLPFEIQLGISKKFAHAPFRLSVIAEHLETPDLSYIDPNNAVETDPLTGEETEVKIGIGDKMMRHVIIGGEFLPSDNFSLRLGYNYRRQKELGIGAGLSLTGFSFGVGLKISKFNISYGRANYSVAGATNHITITTKFSDFKRKTKPKEND